MPNTEISVLAEMERYKIAFDWAGAEEIKLKCPFHADDKPSLNLSISKRLFCCHAGSCGKTGDIVTLLAKFSGQTRSQTLEELSTRYDLDDSKIVDIETIERWHEAIWQAAPLLAELRKRAVTDDDIKAYRLGVNNGRITIPIQNNRGDYVNVRQYLPGASGPDKMRNLRGRGAARWFPEKQLGYDAIVLCGGEIKSIVAARILNSQGIGCAWVTHGEKLIPPKLMERLRGKSVALCLDVDAAGRTATENNARALKSIASELLTMTLPLDLEKYPKGDINDFVAMGGDLWQVYQDAEIWQEQQAVLLDDSPPESITLSQASNAKYAGKRVAITAITTAMDTAPYVVPRDVTVKCDKSQKDLCCLCPVFSSDDGRFNIPIESPAILEAVHAPKHAVHAAILSGVGIPASCRVCSFNVETYYNAEDVRLSPQLEITDRTANQKIQPAVCIGTGLDLNEPYKMVGRMWPHPQTQQSTLLISSYEQTRDALSTYEAKDLQILKIFQPEEWTVESIGLQLDRLYADLEMNATRIWKRRDIHLIADLTYHSPRFIKVQNELVNGWVQSLIVGDSSQGKSEVVCGKDGNGGLMRHYGLGERIECKNASVAGLLGGLKQMGTRWFGEWGLLAKHDSRLLIMDEVKGMETTVIGKLTDLRSSGVAEISKIEKMRTHARTRQIWISNPRMEGRRVSSYAFGVDIVRELIGSLEDVRRFDVALVVADYEVDTEEINRLHAARNGAHCKHSSDLCRALILWAWTRTPEQCVIDKDVTLLAMEESNKLCKMFTSAIPIIDGGSTRFKLLRLAAALAARTFSCGDDMTTLKVRECHIQYVSEMLQRIYSKPAMGYIEYTKSIHQTEELVEPDIVRKHIAAVPFPYEFVESMLKSDMIESQDIQDWCGWTRIESANILSILVRKHAFKRDGRGYRKTAAFVELLRSLLESKSIPDRPSFLPEREF